MNEKLIKYIGSISNQSLLELVEKLVRDKGPKYREAARTVYILWKHEALELSEPKPAKPMVLGRHSASCVNDSHSFLFG
jgi:hypothetical protein